MRVSGKVVTGTVPHREVQEVTGTFPSSLEQIESKQFQVHKKLKKKKSSRCLLSNILLSTMRIQNLQYAPFFSAFKKFIT